MWFMVLFPTHHYFSMNIILNWPTTNQIMNLMKSNFQCPGMGPCGPGFSYATVELTIEETGQEQQPVM